MNERIKELGDQAWDYALDHETVNGKAAFGSFINKNFSDLLLEKFAELIVKECIEVVDNRSKKNFHPTSFGGELLHYVTTDLKQHFGVEE